MPSPLSSRAAAAPAPRTARWIAHSTVPLALVGNMGCLFLTLFLLENGRSATLAQTEAWQLVTVTALVGFQAVWLVFLRPQPVGTLLGSLVLWLAAVLVGDFDLVAVQPGLFFAVFAFTTERAGWTRRILIAVAIFATAITFTAAYALHAPASSPEWNAPAVLLGWVIAALATVGGPALAGAWYTGLRDRAERIAELAQRASSGEAARTAEAVAAERRTLAQEIHDTSSAHLAAMLALSAAAEAGALKGGPAHQRLIEQIRDEGERLYQGFERMLNSMRQEDRTVTETHQPGARAGQHSVAEIVALVDEHRVVAGGSRVALTHAPDLREIDYRLGPMRAHIAYRVVQEGLSNARKHAPGASIALSLEDDGTTLLLRIENDAAAVSTATGAGAVRSLSLGYGLEGMRDRLVAAGGSLRTGPRQTGGWSVNALLPHPPHQRTDPPARPSRRAIREAGPPAARLEGVAS